MLNSSQKESLKKKSILIPDGESCFCLPVLTCLNQCNGLKIYVLTSTKNTIQRFSIYRTKFLFVKPRQTDNDWINSIQQYTHDLCIDVILPVDQFAINLLSEHRKSFHPEIRIVPLPTTSSFKIASDKWLLAEFLVAHKLPLPATVVFESKDFSEIDLSTLKFPVLTKFRISSGGEGIQLWSDEKKLIPYLNEIDGFSEILIQSYIEGYNIGCSVLCQDGKILAYTIQKELLQGDTKFSPSVGIRFVEEQKVHTLIEQLMLSLNWSGIAHIDLRYDAVENTFKILEINPRFWGSLVGSLNVGVNFPYLACLTALKIPFTPPRYSLRPFFHFWLIVNMLKKGSINTIPHQFSVLNDTNLKYSIRDPLPSLIKLFYLIKSKIQQTIFM